MSPVDLHRKEPDNVPPFYNLSRKLEAFILSHASFFLILALIVLMMLFIMLCYAICGVSATESGTVYNHLEGVI